VSPAIGMGIVVAAFGLLMAPVLLLRRAGRLSAEGSRKLIHVGMGLVVATFPWIFTVLWPVLALTGGFVLLLAALRVVPALRERFGAALCGVERASWGDLYFPIAAGGLFCLTHAQPVNYVIPILILALADAAAALIGTRFGRHCYLADEGEKSWEGSAAFLVVALGCVFVPLLVVGVAPWHALLTGLIIAAVTMLLEATAWRGLDNLFVPFATLVMLRLYHDVPAAVLERHLGGLLVLAGLHLLFRRRVLLREGTLLGALVVVYLCWTLGNFSWAIGPMMVLVTHPILNVGRRADTSFYLRSHPTLLAFVAPPLGWLLLDRLLGVHGFGPFNIAFGAQMSLAAVSLWRAHERPRGWLLILPATAFGWVLLVLPWWLAGSLPGRTALLAAGNFLMIDAIFFSLQPMLASRPIRHWNLRATLAALASLAGM